MRGSSTFKSLAIYCPSRAWTFSRRKAQNPENRDCSAGGSCPSVLLPQCSLLAVGRRAVDRLDPVGPLATSEAAPKEATSLAPSRVGVSEVGIPARFSFLTPGDLGAPLHCTPSDRAGACGWWKPCLPTLAPGAHVRTSNRSVGPWRRGTWGREQPTSHCLRQSPLSPEPLLGFFPGQAPSLWSTRPLRDW